MLVVVFGAGASHDSDSECRLGVTEPVPHRLPLTDDLFSSSVTYVKEALADFPQFNPIIARLRRRSNDSTIERVLAELQTEQSAFPDRLFQLAAIRFYLREVLWRLGERWLSDCAGATNYSTLLGTLYDWEATSRESLTLVTFNYDTLLEHAIVNSTGFDPRSSNSADLDGYLWIPHGIRLFKPHGSINWARPVSRVMPDGTSLDSLTSMIFAADRLSFDSRFEIVTQWNQPTSRYVECLPFPALAIPVDVKDSFECPDRHIEELKHCLAEADRVVLIGWRAAEATFLELWREARGERPAKVLIVSPGSPEATARLVEVAGINCEATVCKLGFSDFAERPDLATWLRT